MQHWTTIARPIAQLSVVFRDRSGCGTFGAIARHKVQLNKSVVRIPSTVARCGR